MKILGIQIPAIVLAFLTAILGFILGRKQGAAMAAAAPA